MALAFQAIMWKKYQKRNKHIESSIIYASLLIITSSLLIIIIPLAFLCHLPSLLLLCLLFSRPSTFFLLLSYLILGTVVRCREGDWQLDLSLDLELLLSSKTIIKGGGYNWHLKLLFLDVVTWNFTHKCISVWKTSSENVKATFYDHLNDIHIYCNRCLVLRVLHTHPSDDEAIIR